MGILGCRQVTDAFAEVAPAIPSDGWIAYPEEPPTMTDRRPVVVLAANREVRERDVTSGDLARLEAIADFRFAEFDRPTSWDRATATRRGRRTAADRCDRRCPGAHRVPRIAAHHRRDHGRLPQAALHRRAGGRPLRASHRHGCRLGAWHPHRGHHERLVIRRIGMGAGHDDHRPAERRRVVPRIVIDRQEQFYPAWHGGSGVPHGRADGPARGAHRLRHHRSAPAGAPGSLPLHHRTSTTPMCRGSSRTSTT